MGLCRGCNKYFTVAILTAINLLNYMDRLTIAGILGELQNPDRNGFRNRESVDDKMGGLLQTAFIVSYMLLSPLFGYLGDRFIRKYIISVGILIWSAFTLAGSFSVNYVMLLLTRMLVGVGEASYATIAPTMIADLFPTETRLRMLTIFYIAVPLGSALGYIIGSEVSALVYKFAHTSASWRWALRITPGLGVVAALLVLLVVREPKRGHTDGHRSAQGVRGKGGFSAYITDVLYCFTNMTFVLTTLGFTAVTFTTGALAQWAPLFISRVSNVVIPDDPYSNSKAAILFGGITVVAGILGTVAGSELSKLLGRWTRKAEALVCALGMLVGTPLMFLALSVPQYKMLYLAWVLVFFAEVFLCLNWAPVSAILLYIIVPARRSTAEAVQILFSHLFGDAASPFIVGAISDSIYDQTQGFVREPRAFATEFALYTTVFVCLLGGAAFLLSTFTVEKDRKAVEAYVASTNMRIQRSDSETSSDDFDEHHRLLDDALANHQT